MRARQRDVSILHFADILTDHGQIVAEAARLTLAEVHAASVRRRVVPLYVVDHQDRRAREGRPEKGTWPENTRVRRVLRARHGLLARVDSAKERDKPAGYDNIQQLANEIFKLRSQPPELLQANFFSTHM